MEEIWASIGGEYANYSISNFGQLRNEKSGRVLRCSPDNVGYPSAYLSGGSKDIRTTVRLHRLVAKHYVDNPEPEKFVVVNHMDGNKTNNHFSNLEWTTLEDNITHAFDSGISKGRGHEFDIYQHLDEVEQLLIEGKSYSYIMKVFGVSYKTLKNIKEKYGFYKPEAAPSNKIYISENNLENSFNRFKSGEMIKDVSESMGLKPPTLTTRWKSVYGIDSYKKAKEEHLVDKRQFK